tara:strand:+ start:5980 stop:6951 length:972 start_codon:yes stop_codon:yes gene_type:complete
MKRNILYAAILLLFVTISCTDQDDQSPKLTEDFNRERLKTAEIDAGNLSSARLSGDIEGFMSTANEALISQNLQLSAIEAYAADGEGIVVYFNNRGNKQLSADFVPGDPRRGGFLDIAYARDGTEGATSSGLSQGDTDAAVLSAMSTWDGVTCSDGLIITNLGASNFDLGYVEALVTNGVEGSFFFTDIMHSGFNTTVTDAIYGPGSNVLGVTFTFIWLDDDGNPSDIDNNGKDDVAFRDIYYNDEFSWAIGNHIDVETVALHEAGHGLSQAHFGTLFQTESNGEFHFAPRAVMNAGYTGIQTSIKRTDRAGHCSNWSMWPNN